MDEENQYFNDNSSLTSFFAKVMFTIGAAVLIYLWWKRKDATEDDVKDDVATETKESEQSQSSSNVDNSTIEKDITASEELINNNLPGTKDKQNNEKFRNVVTSESEVQTESQNVMLWRAVVVNEACNCKEHFRSELNILYDGKNFETVR